MFAMPFPILGTGNTNKLNYGKGICKRIGNR